MDFEGLTQELGLPAPGSLGQEPEAEVSNNIPAAEDRVESILNGAMSGKPAQEEETLPAAEQPAQPEGTEKPAGGEVDFVEASKSAFLGEDGSIDSSRVGDFLVNKGKSFMQFASQPAQQELTGKPESKITPEKEYFDSVRAITESLPDILENELAEGRTPAETLQRLKNTFDGFVASREQKEAAQAALEASQGEFRAEVEQIREQKVQAQIDRNYSEMSSLLDGMIPGMKGSQVLDKFVLAPEYGGVMLERLFQRDNPKFSSVPEAERSDYTNKWFRGLQANRADLALIAEFGRAKWALEQLPHIAQHGKKIGAAFGYAVQSTKGGKPSTLQSAEPKQSAAMSEFFGYDTVN